MAKRPAAAGSGSIRKRTVTRKDGTTRTFWEARYCNLFIVALFTGMRQGELLWLSWDYVNFETGVITIKQQLQCKDGKYFLETPKSGKGRSILPAPVVMEALKKEREKQQVAKAFAVTSLYAGDDIKSVQANLCHATAQFTLDVYGHVTQTMRKESAERMQRFYDQLYTQKN